MITHFENLYIIAMGREVMRETEEKNMISVVYSIYKTSDKYYFFLFRSMKSLFEMHPDQKLKVYLIYSDLAKKDIKELKTLAQKFKQELIFISFPLQKYEEKLNSLMGCSSLLGINAHFSTMYRLFIGELLPRKLNKVLFLDCDTIIKGNLKNFYNTPFEGKSLIVTKLPCKGPLTDPGVRTTIRDYFNMSVAIFNLKKTRKILLKESLKVSKAYRGLFMDQDILNIIFSSDKKIVATKYNYILGVPYEDCRFKDAIIISVGGSSFERYYYFSKEIRQFLRDYYKDFSIPKPRIYHLFAKIIFSFTPPTLFFIIRIYKNRKKLFGHFL